MLSVGEHELDSDSITGFEQPSEQVTTSGSSTLSTSSLPSVDRTQLAVILASTGLVALCFLMYLPILFNFFVCDDYTHVDWLRRAILDPQLVLRNFYSCWLDVPTARFYRPMISVTLFADYLLWHENALGFHITNVALHAATTVFMFLSFRNLAARVWAGDSFKCWVFSLASSAMFALYPIHPEVVSWVTGRVDSVMAMFFLAALWCYTEWRDTSRKAWFSAAIVAAVFCFLSKEMALALPPVLTACEFFVYRSDPRSFWKDALAALRATNVFYIVLAIYFVVRTLALGTVVGGYDNGFGFVGTWAQQIEIWRSGLSMVFIPANTALVSENNFFLRAWYVTFPVSVVALIYAMRASSNRGLISFLLCWSLLSILPVYKIFSIGFDLQGSRLAYLGTAPWAALLVVGMSVLAGEVKKAPVRLICLAAILLQLVACGGLLARNNKAWVQAGQEMNAIRAGSNKILDATPPGETALFLNLPDNVNGAFVGRNALGGMTNFRPQSVAGLAKGDPIGFFKKSITEDLHRIKVYRWRGAAAGFETLSTNDWKRQLGSMTALPLNLSNASGLSEVVTGANGRTEFSVGPFAGDSDIAVSADCWNIDFVRVYFRRLDTGIQDNAIGVRCSNKIVPALEVWQPCPTDNKVNCATFNLHQNPDWAFGGKCERMTLLFRANAKYAIERIELTPPSIVLPQVQFGGETFAQSRGILFLKPGKHQKLKVDATQLPGVSDVVVEVTHASRMFADTNAYEPDKQRLLHEWKRAGQKAEFEFNHRNLPSTGLYQVRARALDKSGKQVSLASDNFTLLVE